MTHPTTTSDGRNGSREPRPELGETHEITPTISTRALFNGRREIGIEHDGALYRLKITRQGKLILNK